MAAPGTKSGSQLNTGNAFTNKSKTVTQTGQISPKSSTQIPSSMRENQLVSVIPAYDSMVINQIQQRKTTEETTITHISKEVKIPNPQPEKSQFRQPRTLQIEIGQTEGMPYLPQNTEESDENIRMIKAGLINEAWKQATSDSFQFGTQGVKSGFGAFQPDPHNKSIGVGDDNSIIYNTREYPLRPIEEIGNREQSQGQGQFQTISDGFPVRKSAAKLHGAFQRSQKQNEGVLQVAGSAVSQQAQQHQVLHQKQGPLQSTVSGGESISQSSTRRKQMIEIRKSAAVTITQEFKGGLDPKSARQTTKGRHKKSQEQLLKDMKAKYVLEENSDLNFQTIDPNVFYNESSVQEAKLRKSIYSENFTKVSSSNAKQRANRDSWAVSKGARTTNQMSGSTHESAKNLLSARQQRRGINGIVASGSISFRQMHKNLARKLVSSANQHRDQDEEFSGRIVFSDQGTGEMMARRYSNHKMSSKGSAAQLNSAMKQERIVSDERVMTAAWQDAKRKTEFRYTHLNHPKSGTATHRGRRQKHAFPNSIGDKLEKSPTADDMQFGEQGLDEQFFRKNYSTISQTQQNVLTMTQATTKRSPNNGGAGRMYIQESTASKTKMSSTVSKSLLNSRAQRNAPKTKSKSTSRNRKPSVGKKRKMSIGGLFGKELTEKQKQIAEFRKQKGQKEDQDPFGIENDDYEKNRMKKLMKLKKQKHLKSADRPSDEEESKSPEIKANKVDKRIRDQATIIDYPRHIRISSQIQSLEQVRESLREQKFFYHKFDPLKSDYASQHIYKNVYRENEKINPYDEKKLSANEYIRFNCPENMKTEPTMTLTKNADKKQDRMGVRNNKKYRTMSLAEQQYFKRMKNRPTELLRMWAHKNAKYDMQDESEEKNSSSQAQENRNELEEVPLKVPAHRMAYINNEIDKKTLGVYKHNSSFANQRRMIETQMDQGMVIQVNDYETSDGKVFEAAINKIIKTQRDLDKKQGNLKTSYFQAKREEEDKKRREMLEKEQESMHTMMRSSNPNETIPTQNSEMDMKSQEGIESFLKGGAGASPTLKTKGRESPSPAEPPKSPNTKFKKRDLDNTNSTIQFKSKKNMEMNDLKKLIDNALKLNQKKPSAASPKKEQPGNKIHPLAVKEQQSKRSSSPEHASFHSGDVRASSQNRSSPLQMTEGPEKGMKRLQPSSKQINNDLFRLSEIPEKGESPMSLRNKKFSKYSQGGSSMAKLPRPREDSESHRSRSPKGNALRNFVATSKSFKMQKIKNTDQPEEEEQDQEKNVKSGENIKIEIQGNNEQVTTETDEDGQVIMQESYQDPKEREEKFKVNFPANITRSHDDRDREKSPGPSVRGSILDNMMKNEQDMKLRGDLAKKRAIHDAKILLKDRKKQQQQRKKNKQQSSDKSPLQDEQSTTNHIKRQLELRKIKQRLKEGGYEDILNHIDFEKNYSKISKDNYLKIKELELKQVKDQENLMAQIEESVNDQFSSSLSTTRIQEDLISNGRSRVSQGSKNNFMFIVKSPLGSQARSRSRQNGGVLSPVGNPLHSSHNSGNLFQTLDANIPVRLSQNVNKIEGDFTNTSRTRVVLKSPLNSVPCSNRSSSKCSEEGGNQTSNKKTNRYGVKQSTQRLQKLPQVDFSKTSPDIERKITQYIKRISKGTNALIKDKESQNSLNQIPNQDIGDLNLILRQCFSEREFVKEDLGPKIDAEANYIYDYNCKYLMAVSKLQENLIILEEQNKNNIDAQEFESYFNAEQIMKDQKRNDEENEENILKKDDKGSAVKKESSGKDLSNQNQMRLLLGGALAGGKSKIWKPNKMEFGKDLKYLQFMNFNAQSGTMKLSRKKKQNQKDEKKKKAA